MARFKPMELMSEVHGKLHGKSEYYAAEKYGTQFTGKIGEITVPATEKQITARQRFAQTYESIAALTPEQIADYKAAFKRSPGKYKSLQGYIFAQVYQNL